MDYIMPVQNSEGCYNLREILHGISFIKLLDLLKHLLEGSAITELVHKIKIVECLEHVIIFDDMLAGFEVAQNVDFVDCPLLQLG